MVESFPFQKAIAAKYLLQLGNGLGWHLTATAGVKSEVEELARIMGLSCCTANGYPRLIFIRGATAKKTAERRRCRLSENLERDLYDVGWNAHDLDLLKLWSHHEVEDLVCEMRNEEDNYLLSLSSMRLALYPIYQAAQDSGGFPLHGALVERDGKGVLLAGPRETGKTTCCRRIPKPWHALCDEETLIVRNDQKEYLAHPFPTWSEYLEERSKRAWNTQLHIPLCVIFFLQQANRDEVIHLGPGEAAVLVYQSAVQMMYRYWKDLDHKVLRTKKKRLFENACQLSESVPAFRLHVSVNGRFWEKIEAVLP
jgi:SynChlorMet cassette protein ScmC